MSADSSGTSLARWGERALAASLIVVTLPLWLLVAVAIRLESRGPGRPGHASEHRRRGGAPGLGAAADRRHAPPGALQHHSEGGRRAPRAGPPPGETPGF